jgi:hypothetical protein
VLYLNLLILAETSIVLCSSLKLLLHQIIWPVIFLAKTRLLAVVPNCLLNMSLSCDSNTILVRGNDALVCCRCCILVPLTVMRTCFLPSAHGSNAVVLVVSIVLHHNLAVLTIMLVPIFFSTTAKPNFITRKQRNYKSLKTINAIVNAVLAKEQPTWSEHRGFKPKDRTELTYHTKGLAANQTSPRSLTNRTEHCDLLHAFQGKAAVQKTDCTLTVSHKETLNMLLPQTIAIRLSQPSICT